MSTTTMEAEVLTETVADMARIADRYRTERDDARRALGMARRELAELRQSLADAEIFPADDAPEFAVDGGTIAVTRSGLVWLRAGEWIVGLGSARDDLGRRLAKVWGRWEDQQATAERDETAAYYFSERGVS